MNASLATIAQNAEPEILNYFPRLDVLLKTAVARARHLYYASEQEESFHGLYISEQEVDGLLDRTETIGSREAATVFLRSCATLPGIAGLSAYWQLSPFDHAVMLLALAPEVDLRYERIYAYLQDDITRRKPTVDLALNLLAVDACDRLANRMRFLPDAPLVRSNLLRLIPDPGHVEAPLLGHYLKLDESLARLLLGDPDPDPRLSSFCEFVSGVESVSRDEDILRRLPPFITASRKQRRAIRLLFSGAPPSAVPESVAFTLGAPLLTANFSRNPNWRSDPAGIAALLVREASRTGAVFHINGLDSPGEPAALQVLIDGLVQYRGAITVASRSAAVAAALANERFFPIVFPAPDFQTRSALWQSTIASAGIAVEPGTVPMLASRFVHDAEQIDEAVRTTCQSLEWQSTTTQRLSSEEITSALMTSARAQSATELASLTSKLKPIYRWSDIVLPQDAIDQLKEICQRVAHGHEVLECGGFGKKLSAGKGVAVLFAGPSGTGKTMAAEVMANDLGLDLFRIDLSTVVSKYIGETEKNLERIFNAATHSNSVLLFDEADALCGRRSEVRDAHDRYANIEISYLLQKMEQYEGIAILTTNLRGNLDEAFVRRLAFTVHFPFPEESDRLEIWKRIWPEETRLDPQLDFSALAKHFRLSGGNIKNIALATAFLAAAEARPVRMGDILHSTRREYEKVGKVLSAAEIEAVVQ
jgi:ATP-dependent 26S proteasome regulatory subunit